MTTRLRDKGLTEENCPSCKKGCVACFDAGKSHVEPVREELDAVRGVLTQIAALHYQIVVSEELGYCAFCGVRWPCETVTAIQGVTPSD